MDKPISSEQLQAQRQAYMPQGVFQLKTVAIEKAKGAKVWGVGGNEYTQWQSKCFV